MSAIFVHGLGAVSPAGWNLASFREALGKNEPLPTKDLLRPGWEIPLRIRPVPTPQPRPAFLTHARLRRSSPVAQYTVAAGLEALGDDRVKVESGTIRLGIVLCVMSGCVNYSKRFYDETLRNPATASPLVFPETVFNAPASHLAALLGTTAINYTLVGDQGTFLQGLALASDWLLEKRIDGCLVIAAEENDWLTANAYKLFARKIVLSDGAGAVYLRRDEPQTHKIELTCVTDSHLFSPTQSRHCAAVKMQSQFPLIPNAVLCDGTVGVSKVDAAEIEAWKAWSGRRLSPKRVFGESLAASGAWQTVAAIDSLSHGAPAANVSVVGSNQQAVGAQFRRMP